MKKKEFAQLLGVIGSILLMSVILGDILITPIVLYHKVLVRFFGIFFLFLVFLLLFAKLKTNYDFIRLHAVPNPDFPALLTRTLKETTIQLFTKLSGIVVFFGFLLIIGAATIFAIWLNGNLFKIGGD